MNFFTSRPQETVLIIDETAPSDVFSTLRDQRNAIQERQAHGREGNTWYSHALKVV
jgi:hypothetical protein